MLSLFTSNRKSSSAKVSVTDSVIINLQSPGGDMNVFIIFKNTHPCSLSQACFIN